MRKFSIHKTNEKGAGVELREEECTRIVYNVKEGKGGRGNEGGGGGGVTRYSLSENGVIRVSRDDSSSSSSSTSSSLSAPTSSSSSLLDCLCYVTGSQIGICERLSRPSLRSPPPQLQVFSLPSPSSSPQDNDVTMGEEETEGKSKEKEKKKEQEATLLLEGGEGEKYPMDPNFVCVDTLCSTYDPVRDILWTFSSESGCFGEFKNLGGEENKEGSSSLSSFSPSSSLSPLESALMILTHLDKSSTSSPLSPSPSSPSSSIDEERATQLTKIYEVLVEIVRDVLTYSHTKKNKEPLNGEEEERLGQFLLSSLRILKSKLREFPLSQASQDPFQNALSKTHQLLLIFMNDNTTTTTATSLSFPHDFFGQKITHEVVEEGCHALVVGLPLFYRTPSSQSSFLVSLLRSHCRKGEVVVMGEGEEEGKKEMEGGVSFVALLLEKFSGSEEARFLLGLEKKGEKGGENRLGEEGEGVGGAVGLLEALLQFCFMETCRQIDGLIATSSSSSSSFSSSLPFSSFLPSIHYSISLLLYLQRILFSEAMKGEKVRREYSRLVFNFSERLVQKYSKFFHLARVMHCIEVFFVHLYLYLYLYL